MYEQASDESAMPNAEVASSERKMVAAERHSCHPYVGQRLGM
jgi:hypothetical protein